MSSVLRRLRPAAAPRLDPRLPRPAVNAAFVPQSRAALLRRAVRRVLGLWYPPVPADVAYGNSHCLPAHAAIISYSALRT